MKRMKTICIICFIALIILVGTVPCYAEFDVDKSMVYASTEQQEQIYKLLQQDNYDYYSILKLYSLSIVKESITPVYTIDLIEYAKTGNYRVYPAWCTHTGIPDDGKGNVYVAKTITAKNEFGGNIRFYVENGVAYTLFYNPSEYSDLWQGNGANYHASASYADHARRIAVAMKESELVSPYYVKYVVIDQLGDFFYVDNGKSQILVAQGHVQTKTGNETFLNTDCTIDPNSELLMMASEYLSEINAYQREKAEWEAEHPEETWIQLGSFSISPVISGCSYVDDIIDISDFFSDVKYMGKQDSVSINIKNDEKEHWSKIKVTSLILVGLFVALLMVCVVIVKLKRKMDNIKAQCYNESSGLINE